MGNDTMSSNMPLGTSFVDLSNVGLVHGGLKAALDRIFRIRGNDTLVNNSHLNDFSLHIFHYFDNEERMMELIKYPLRLVHSEDHRCLMEMAINEINAGINSGASCAEVRDSLTRVFIHHENNLDLVFDDYTKKKYTT